MNSSPPRRPHGPRSSWSRDGRRPQRARPTGGGDGPVQLYGVHAVEAALRNPQRSVIRLLMTENAENRLAEAIAARQIAPTRVSPRELDRMLGVDTVHQGILLETDQLEEPDIAELAERADDGPLIVLDHVTDPHNVGAILRSAAVFGAKGLIMTRRHSPPLDGALAKSASGALEHVPIALAQNLARAIDELKKEGCMTIGLDGAGTSLLEEDPLAGRLVLVLGAEGKGMRELTRTSCERLCRIATAGPIASLNVSNAAAIALHLAAWRRSQR